MLGKEKKRIIVKLDNIQNRLERLGDFNRSYDDVMYDVKKKIYAKKHVNRMVNQKIANNTESLIPITKTNVAICLVALLLFITFISLLGGAPITGFSVADSGDSSESLLTANFILVLISCVTTISFMIAGFMIYKNFKEHR